MVTHALPSGEKSRPSPGVDSGQFLLGGQLFGLPGIIVAVPVAASLRVILLHGLKAYQESAVYLGTGDSPPK